MRRVKAILRITLVVPLLVALVAVGLRTGPAAAVTSAVGATVQREPSVNSASSEVFDVSWVDENTMVVSVDDEQYTIVRSDATSAILFIDSASTSDEWQTIPFSGVPDGYLGETAATQEDLDAALLLGEYAANGVSCSMLIWAVGIIHSYSWAAAVGIILATGAVGTAIAATIYYIGVSGFLAWVSTKC